MLKVYGLPACHYCVECKEDLEKAGVPFMYLNIGENLLFMKQFLKMRDHHEAFASIREKGQIGIPAIVDKEGNISLTWEQYL